MKLWLVVAILILIVVVALVLYYFTSTSRPAIERLEQTPVVQKLDDRQLKIIDILIEENKLLSSLATLIIGGTGVLMLRGPLPPSAWVLLLLSWLALGASLLFGYLHYEGLLLMLNYQFFQPFAAYFRRWSEAQFWSFIVGLAISVLFLVQVAVSSRGKRGESHDALR